MSNPKVHTGPKGGQYVIQGGRKKYLKGASVSGRGLYALRQPKGIRGRGAYRSAGFPQMPKRRAVRGKGSFIDAAMAGSRKYVKPFERIGSAFGAPGAAIGRWLGGITGLGDYKVGQNSLLGMAVGGDGAGTLPEVQNVSGRFIMTHREYIKDILSEEDFTVEGFKINPGLQTTFPWLATIAQQFEQWRPLGIVFQFKSTSADALNSTNTALGTIIMATDYNAASSNFVGKQQMDNTEYVTSTKPSCSVLHPIECSPAESPTDVYYVRTGAVPSGQDPRLYDLGNFQIAAVGSQAEAVVGELWVTYQIELLKPVLTEATGESTPFAHFLMGGTPTAALPLGSAAATVLFNNTDWQCDFATRQLVNLKVQPNSKWFMVWNVKGTVLAGANTYPGVTSPDGAMLDLFQNQTSSFSPTSAQTSAEMVGVYAAVADPATGILNFQFDGAGVLPTSITRGEIFIMKINLNAELPRQAFKQKRLLREPEQTPYERRLRAFMKAPENSALTAEARIVLFDRLEAQRDQDDEKETSVGGPAVDLSVSQLIEKAVKKAVK